MPSPHLVFVTSIVPHGVPTTGYEVANAAVVDGLRRSGAKVTVLGFTWPGVKADAADTVVLGEVEVRTEGAGIRRKIGWVLKSFLAGLTVSSAKLRVIPAETLRAAIAKIGPFDAYVLNGVTLPGAFEDIFKGKPSLFVAHNVEYRSAEENAADAGSFIQKFLFGREARILKGLESRLIGNARFVFTFAEDDGPALGLGRDRFATMPLVTPGGMQAAQQRPVKYDLALIGTWTWHPNRIGLEWFLREVKPHLPDDISIAIAGNTPADLIATWSGVGSGINFVGKVPDATEFVESGALVPLISRAGTGVQLKTIETFELGMPSVATSHSVRGIGNIPDNCTIADAPQGFAAAIVERIEKIRSGDRQRLDGKAFTRSQIEGMDRAVARGLQALRGEEKNTDQE